MIAGRIDSSSSTSLKNFFATATSASPGQAVNQSIAPKRRSPEKNYASYVGIETKNPEDMAKVVKLFKQNTSYRKGESVGKRDFV